MDNTLIEKKVLNLDKSTWKLTKIGELAQDISKRVENPGDSEYDRFVGLGNFVSGDLKIKTWETTENLTSSAKAFKAGDILFARRNAYLRRASLVDFDGCCSGDAFVLRENHEKVVPGFLVFLMNSNALWDFANSNAAGTMSKRVKWRDLANYEFLLPPKDQQAQLAELLWAMDAVVEETISVKNSLYVIKKAILKNLFELNWSSDTPFLSAFSQKDFSQKKFAEICSESMFGPRFSSKQYSKNGTIACLRTTDMDLEGNINFETMPLADLPEGKFKEHYLKTGDILISRSGTCGLTGVFNGYQIPVLPAAFIIRFRLNEGAYPQYVKLFFNSDYGKSITNSLASGAVQKNLTSKALLGIKIPIPKRAIQEQIINLVSNLGISGCTNKIASSQALQKSLINQVF